MGGEENIAPTPPFTEEPEAEPIQLSDALVHELSEVGVRLNKELLSAVSSGIGLIAGIATFASLQGLHEVTIEIDANGKLRIKITPKKR
uniref:Uncharacterized protein n=1 Tax=Cyanothece sp. (strain PCC 7425 / ATCC 29141) TaxID=395961 RepID=B8HZ63_CYAP4